MKRIPAVVVAAFALMVFASLASASETPVVDARQANQHARIRDGVEDGELTRGEELRLRKGQARIRRMERRAKADGVVTPEERGRIAHAQNHQSRKVARLKHNGRER